MKVLNLNTAAVVTAMLETVVKNGTARSADIGKPAAAKTGTTDDNKDASFYGYTPDAVMGVWVGNDDNSNMYGVYGGTIPAMIWKDSMKVITEKFGNSKFDYPPIELKRTGPTNVTVISDEEAFNQNYNFDFGPETDTNKDLNNKETKTEKTQKDTTQNVTNPVSFNNAFLEPAKPTTQNQNLPQVVPMAPIPPIPSGR